MKISRRAVAIFLVASTTAAVALVLSLNVLIEKNRGRLTQEIQRSLGRPLTFDQLRLSFWGGLGLSASQLRVAEDPRFAATPLIQAKELRMQLRWLPLLWGQVEIKSLTMEEPELQIIKNEAGELNLLALAKRDSETKPPRTPKEKKAYAAPRLLISGVHIEDGKIDYIDRSVKEPAEVRVSSVDVDIRGLGLAGSAQIKLAADFFEGQGQNVSLEGRVGPLQTDKDWSQQPLDLQLRVNPLLLPELTRAFPFLREKIPVYPGIIGPLALKATLLGTFQRPRISNIALTGALFGSSRNNAGVSGELDFSRSAAWADGAVKGSVAIEPVTLSQLKQLPFVKQALPASLASEGPLSLAADLQGPLQDLKISGLVKATESEIQYGEWFKKPRGIPAQIEVKAERQKDRIVFQDSTATIHNMKLLVSGLLENSPQQPLTLKLRSDGSELSGWDRLLPSLSSYSLAGNLRLDLAIKKNLGLQDGNFDIRGSLNLADGQFKDKKSGRSADKITAQVAFRGKDARIDNGALRLGSSDVAFDAAVADLSQPVIRYNVRSHKLNLGEATGRADYKADEMRSLLANGDFQIVKGKSWVRGNLTSAEGTLQEIPYRNLRGDVAWASGNLSFKNVSLQALNGTIRATGDWDTGAANSQRLTLQTQVEGMDLKALLAQKFPKFKDRVEGRLNSKAQLRGEAKDSANLQESLQGQGDADIRNGALKDFNLVQLVLSKVSGLPGITDLLTAHLSPRQSAIFKRQDTPFDTLSATFTVEQGRLYSKDLLLATPDYSINGEGWIAFDKSLKWNATLVMAQQFTQELAQEHKNVRYMLDRQGRLAVPFRLEGTIPNVQAKPDLQKLAELLQRGAVTQGIERALGTEKDQDEKGTKKKSTRDLIQKGLDQLFRK